MSGPTRHCSPKAATGLPTDAGRTVLWSAVLRLSRSNGIRPSTLCDCGPAVQRARAGVASVRTHRCAVPRVRRHRWRIVDPCFVSIVVVLLEVSVELWWASGEGEVYHSD